MHFHEVQGLGVLGFGFRVQGFLFRVQRVSGLVSGFASGGSVCFEGDGFIALHPSIVFYVLLG